MEIDIIFPDGKKRGPFEVGVLPVEMPEVPGHERITACLDGNGVAIEEETVRLTLLSQGNLTHSLLDIEELRRNNKRQFYTFQFSK